MSTDGQGTKYRRNIAENFNRLSRVHEHYRQQTDRQMGRRQQIVSSHLLKMKVNNYYYRFMAIIQDNLH